MATPLPTYKFETWMGTLAGSITSGNTTLPWSPVPTCSYITEAVTTIYTNVSLVTTSFQTIISSSQYRMNLTEWLTTNCLPTNWVTGTANYYYPGACPQEWTSWPTVTTITSSIDGSAKEFTLTDAACCPYNYTSLWQGDNIFCRSTLSFQVYDFQVWFLWSTSGASTSHSQVYDKGAPRRHLHPGGQNLTYIPLFVRTGNAGKEFVPTQTAAIDGLTFTGADGVAQTGGVSDGAGDDPARGVNLGLVLGISLPVGIALIAIVAYIFWYCSGKKRQGRARKQEWKEAQAHAVLQNGGARSEDTIMEEAIKPELVGSRPECDITCPVVAKSELHGEGTSGGGVITSLSEVQVDEGTIDNDPGQARRTELDEQARRRGTAETELDGRNRRRAVARAELDGADREQGIVRGPLPDTAALYPVERHWSRGGRDGVECA